MLIDISYLSGLFTKCFILLTICNRFIRNYLYQIRILSGYVSLMIFLCNWKEELQRVVYCARRWLKFHVFFLKMRHPFCFSNRPKSGGIRRNRMLRNSIVFPARSWIREKSVNLKYKNICIEFIEWSKRVGAAVTIRRRLIVYILRNQRDILKFQALKIKYRITQTV